MAWNSVFENVPRHSIVILRFAWPKRGHTIASSCAITHRPTQKHTYTLHTLTPAHVRQYTTYIKYWPSATHTNTLSSHIPSAHAGEATVVFIIGAIEDRDPQQLQQKYHSIPPAR